MTGRLLSIMDYTRMTTLDAVEGLSVEELDYRINGKGNSIGCLLYHMTFLEEIYQISTFEDRDFTKVELQRLTKRHIKKSRIKKLISILNS
jgi:uncharacterized damage-inducible protein DinB